MNGMRVKGMIAVSVFASFAVSILVWGCSMHHHNEDNYKDTAMTSGKALVIELNNNTEYQPLLTGRPQTSGMRSGRVYLMPGETCGQHSTKAHEETLVFLSGRGTALIGEGETPFEVGRGRISYIPPYTLHNIKNTGSEPLVYIYCVAPVNLAAEEHSGQDEHNHSH